MSIFIQTDVLKSDIWKQKWGGGGGWGGGGENEKQKRGKDVLKD